MPFLSSFCRRKAHVTTSTSNIFLISSSFTIDETQLIFSDMLEVYRQDHNEWHAYAKINYYATLSMICTFSFDLYTR